MRSRWVAKQAFQVIREPCWIIARSQLERFTVSKNASDAGTQPLRSRLGFPNRSEHLHDQICVDVGDGNIANDWVDVSFKTLAPLNPMNPPRSAKVVLQLGLDRLVRHYGLAAEIRGRGRSAVRTWLAPGERFVVADEDGGPGFNR